MTRKTPIPPDFAVTDSVREYCARKWDLLYLPDVYLPDFQHTFDSELTGKKPIKHINWDATLKNFIRNESPSGKYYGYGKRWETRCEQARRYKGSASNNDSDSMVERQNGKTPQCEGQNSLRQVPSKPSTWIPTDTGRQALKSMRDYLKGYEHILK